MKRKVEEALEILKTLKDATRKLADPLSVAIVKEYGKNPFLLLVSCLLSLRAKDQKTLPVSRKLLAVVKTPSDLVQMPLPKLEKLIYSIGFYKQKARLLKSVSKQLLENFDGKVPKTREELLSINGIGPKTTALVLGMAFDIPAICVDVHVHRLANKLGLVKTQTPLETEKALEELFPRKHWIELNHILVKTGQNIAEVVTELPVSLQKKLRTVVPKYVKF